MREHSLRVLRPFLKTLNLVPDILMGFVISTILLRGANRESHGQNSSTLQKFEKSSQNTLPPYLQLAVGLSTNVYTTTPMLTNQNDTRETPENTLCVYQRHARILFACILMCAKCGCRFVDCRCHSCVSLL